MNISLSEILLILLIAFLVIKPEKLPEVFATLGKWVRQIRLSISKLKNEIENSKK